MTLLEVAKELGERLVRLFLKDASGARPAMGTAQSFKDDPHWRELLQFHEYFHGDSGAGIGASHQTGWTGCVARIIQANALLTPQLLLTPGAEATIFKVMLAPRGAPPRRLLTCLRQPPSRSLMKSYYDHMKLPQPVLPSQHRRC